MAGGQTLYQWPEVRFLLTFLKALGTLYKIRVCVCVCMRASVVTLDSESKRFEEHLRPAVVAHLPISSLGSRSADRVRAQFPDAHPQPAGLSCSRRRPLSLFDGRAGGRPHPAQRSLEVSAELASLPFPSNSPI
jgi:hypothetical protein